MFFIRTLFGAELSRHEVNYGPGFRKGLLPRNKAKVYLVDFAGYGLANHEASTADPSHGQHGTILWFHKRLTAKNGQSSLSA